jgi:hypothetical protein
MLTGAACRGTSGPAGRLCNAATTRVFDPITDWIKKKAEDFVAGRFSTGDGAATETVGGAGADGADWGINWLIDWGLDHATDFAADHGLELHDTRGYGGDRRIH